VHLGFSAIEENLACLLRAGVNAGAPNLLWGTTGAPRGTGGCISVCFEWRRSWRLQLCCAGYKNPVLRVNVRRSEHPLPRVPSDRGLEFRVRTSPSRLRARAVGSSRHRGTIGATGEPRDSTEEGSAAHRAPQTAYVRLHSANTACTKAKAGCSPSSAVALFQSMSRRKEHGHHHASWLALQQEKKRHTLRAMKGRD